MPLLADPSALLGLCVALGIGLLIGAERERRKGEGPSRAAAGIRTFSAAALLGAVAQLLGGAVVAVATACVGVLALLAYRRSREQDPGLTTEIALLLTCVLGALAVPRPTLAAAVGVVLAALLAARERLHRFVRRVLTEQELHDAIVLLATALIVLPLAPDRFMGPFDAINPHGIARLVVLVMAISAFGYAAVRALGVQHGLPLAGLAGGFVSSTATIHAMGQRSRAHASQSAGAVAGAVLSSIATIVLMALMIAAIQPALLRALWLPLGLGGLAATAYGLGFMWRSHAARAETDAGTLGHPFDWKAALAFGLVMAAVLLVSAAFNHWLGARGTLLAAALAGLVDAHANAASMAALVSAGKLAAAESVLPILLGLTTNALMKAVVSWHAGGAAFALRIVPGQLLMLAGVWLGAWLAA